MAASSTLSSVPKLVESAKSLEHLIGTGRAGPGAGQRGEGSRPARRRPVSAPDSSANERGQTSVMKWRSFAAHNERWWQKLNLVNGIIRGSHCMSASMGQKRRGAQFGCQLINSSVIGSRRRRRRRLCCCCRKRRRRRPRRASQRSSSSPAPLSSWSPCGDRRRTVRNRRPTRCNIIIIERSLVAIAWTRPDVSRLFCIICHC
jgi:hypothetical protein